MSVQDLSVDAGCDNTDGLEHMCETQERKGAAAMLNSTTLGHLPYTKFGANTHLA